MHAGCNGGDMSGREAVDKLRMMGFSEGAMPLAVDIECECGEVFLMDTFETKCPKCDMVYGVTPCSAHDYTKIKAAGVNY